VLLEPSQSLAADARELLAMNGFASRADVVMSGAGERVERRTIEEDALGFARPVAPRFSTTGDPRPATCDQRHATGDLPSTTSELRPATAVLRPATGDQRPTTYDTPFTTLDDEWRRVGRDPAIVKVDVEGAEAEVLRGAMAMIAATRPILFLELHLDELRARGESVAAMLSPLEALGYRFSDPNGRELSTARIRRSFKAILRLVGRPLLPPQVHRR
jgi:hypothetical protein